ncbi:MAG: hypothetical protein ABSE57_05705 [Bryobacteraceae bacterium]|jgi:hypothetical protein
MTKLLNSVLSTYLRVYRSLITVEPVDEKSLTISFPFHLAANHRIEITITDLGKRRCIVSDSARTLGEIQDAGYALTSQIRERLERIASLSGLRIVNDHLLLESSYAEIGLSIQKFLEASKVIGDVYLVHKQRQAPDEDLIGKVRSVLDSKRILYRQGERIWGQLESHPFDLVTPPNGHPGLAVSVLNGQNTHTVAQIWYYKCDDVRRREQNKNIKLALIYDVRFEQWSEASKAILQTRADVVLPGDSLAELPARLESQGIIESMPVRRPKVLRG